MRRPIGRLVGVLALATALVVPVAGDRAALAAPAAVDQSFGGDGTVSVSFAPSPIEYVNSESPIGVDSQNRVIVAGGVGEFRGDSDIGVVRFTEAGTLDGTFATSGRTIVDLGPAKGAVEALVVQPDDKVVLSGWNLAGSTWTGILIRLGSDGSLDPTFGDGGIVRIPSPGVGRFTFTSLAIAPDGDIVVASWFEPGGAGNDIETHQVYRFSGDGSLDTTYGNGGIADVTFVTGGWAALAGMGVDDLDRLVAVGWFYDAAGTPQVRVRRLLADGSPDPAFGDGGSFTTASIDELLPRDAEVRPDGSVLVAGLRREDNLNGFKRAFLLRVTEDGTPDPAYGGDGISEAFTDIYEINDLTVGTNGDLFGLTRAQDYADGRQVVLIDEATGSPDTRFNSDGYADLPHSDYELVALAVDHAGRPVGSVPDLNENRLAAVRLLGPTAVTGSLIPAITFPAEGESVDQGALTVRGTIDAADSEDLWVLYVLDASFDASAAGFDCNGDGELSVLDDLNADGTLGTIIDCEILASISLNQSIAAMPQAASRVHVGLAIYAASAEMADANVAVSQQDFTGPTTDDTDDERDRTPDIVQIAASVETWSVDLFTPKTVATGITDLDEAVALSLDAMAGRPGRKVVVMLNASPSTLSQSTLDDVAVSGVEVRPFAIGPATAGCGFQEPLDDLATASGTSCRTISNPAGLRTSIFDPPPAVTFAAVRIDDGPSIPTLVDPLGNFHAEAFIDDIGSHRATATVEYIDGSRVTVSNDFTTIGGTRYVALGDSYSAGEGIPPYA